MYHAVQTIVLEVSATLSSHMVSLKLSEKTQLLTFLIGKERPLPSPCCLLLSSGLAEPSDPSIPPHSRRDSWKTNLEIYGLFWSAAGQPAGDPGCFDLARNVRNVNVEKLKTLNFQDFKK